MKKKQAPLDAFLATEGAESSATAQELKAQIKTLERRLRKTQTSEASIIEAVHQALADNPPTLSVPKRPKRSAGKYEEIAILHLSDLQIGKVTRSYDTVVAEARILAAMDKTIYITELRRNIAAINELHIYLGGDIVEGEDIFPHQAHEIDSSVFDQACVNSPRILGKAILMALEHYDHVTVFTVAGNHGRNGPKNTRAHPRTNWDQVCYQTLKTLLCGTKDSPRKELAGRLTFNLSEEFWIVDNVFGWGNLLVHGHQMSGGFAGFPWYGVAKKAWGWMDAIEVPWENLFLGHFHTAAMATIGYRRFYANGTTESDNDFAKEQLAACGSPCQRLIFMDAKHGVTADTLIQLADPRPYSKRGKKGDLWKR